MTLPPNIRNVIDLRTDKMKPGHGILVPADSGPADPLRVSGEDASFQNVTKTFFTVADKDDPERKARRFIGMSPYRMAVNGVPREYLLNTPGLVDSHGHLRRDLIAINVTYNAAKGLLAYDFIPDPSYKRSLLDRIQEGLATGHDMIGIHDVRRQPYLGEAVKLNNKLRQAHCFSLDESFVRQAVHLSMEPPHVIYDFWQRAYMPYQSVWIEFDEYFRGQEQYRAVGAEPPDINPDDRQDRTGYLLEMLDGPGNFMLWPIFSSGNGKTYAGYTGLMINALKDATTVQVDFNHPRPNLGFSSSDLSKGTHDYLLSYQLPDEQLTAIEKLLGQRYHDRLIEMMAFGRLYTGAMARGNPEYLPVIDKMVRRIAPVISPFYTIQTLPDSIGELKRGTTEFTKHLLGVSSSVTEGDARFVAIVLGLLQSSWVHTDRIRPAGSRRYVRGKTLPYLEQHTLTIMAPKERILTAKEIASRIAPSGSKRAHEVIGHLCYSQKRLNKDCSHEWKPNGIHTQEECPLCGSLRWYRHPHQRGNAGKGFVDKDYNVTAPE